MRQQALAFRTVGKRHRAGDASLDEERLDGPALHHAVAGDLLLQRSHRVQIIIALANRSAGVLGRRTAVVVIGDAHRAPLGSARLRGWGASLPGVSYHTGVSDEELAALYRRAWVYASPSTYEGFGLPYLEAMACGTAVIATPNPGSCEVLGDGAYGRLAGDAEFGRAILALLNNEHARRRWEASGALRAQQFSLSAMIDRYEALLAKSGDIGARRIASA